MKVGDLVFHLDDIRDGRSGIPGLIIAIGAPTAGASPKNEVVVHFTDRTFNEYHQLSDLIKAEDYKKELA